MLVMYKIHHQINAYQECYIDKGLKRKHNNNKCEFFGARKKGHRKQSNIEKRE
jgi:hypothetical protein